MSKKKEVEKVGRKVLLHFFLFPLSFHYQPNRIRVFFFLYFFLSLFTTNQKMILQKEKIEDFCTGFFYVFILKQEGENWRPHPATGSVEYSSFGKEPPTEKSLYLANETKHSLSSYTSYFWEHKMKMDLASSVGALEPLRMVLNIFSIYLFSLKLPSKSKTNKPDRDGGLVDINLEGGLVELDILCANELHFLHFLFCRCISGYQLWQVIHWCYSLRSRNTMLKSQLLVMNWLRLG